MTALQPAAAQLDAELYDEVAASAAAVDRERAFPAVAIAMLAERGTLGLVVPAEHGGAGAGLAALAQTCELLGGACASTAMVTLMHSVTAATLAGGGGERAASLLSEMAAGACLGSLAFSERGTGAHFYAPELSAIRDGDGAVRITGRKSFVTAAGHADVYLVLVQSTDGAGLDCYAIRAGAPGLAVDGVWQGLGMAGNASVALVLDQVEVRAEDLVGRPGAGAELVFGVVAPFFLVGLAAVNVGIAAAAARAATAHAAERSYADGRTLVEVQTIQHGLAGMDAAVRAARLFVREAARLGEAGDPDALVAIMEAKVLATETARDVTQQALETCGGMAYTPALPIERHLRDARAGAVMAPTNGVLRSWIGKALAGLPVP